MGLRAVDVRSHVSREGADEMRRTKLAAILLTVASLAWVAQAARADDNKGDQGHNKHQTSTHKMSDQQFVVWAATRKAMERELGNMAVRKAANPEIRQFAQRIAHDER